MRGKILDQSHLLNELEKFKNGDFDAVALVIEHYYQPLLNFLVCLGCSRADAEDIIQESLIKAALGLKKQYINSFRSCFFFANQALLVCLRCPGQGDAAANDVQAAFFSFL